MKIVAVITARGGSKTVKSKNIRKVGNLSLIEYTFKELNKTNIKEKFVLTDSKNIKRISKKYKINTSYERPKQYSKDTTSTIETIYHFSEWYLKKNDYDAILCLQPTSPLRSYIDITRSLKIFSNGRYDSLFSISKSLEHPYHTIDFRNDKKIHYVCKESSKYYRKQDYQINSFFINGAIYFIKKNLIKKRKCTVRITTDFI